MLAIAVLMFFFTMVVTNINGAKTSFYYYIWMMVGYYAYKGNLDSIKSMMKIVIFINIGVLALIIPFMDDTALGYLNNSRKLNLIASVIVMVIPKALIYLYCKNQLAKLSQLKFDSNLVQNDNLGRIEDVEIARSQTTAPIPMAYAYKSEDASLGVDSIKSKYKVDDYDLAQASNEIKSKKVNEDIWNHSASKNNRIDDVKRQYIIMRSQEIAYEKYQNNVKEIGAKALVQETDKATITLNHSPEVTRKTVYEMFNERSSSYESTEKYSNNTSKKSDKLVWIIFFVVIIAVLYFIRSHKIVLF